MDDAFFGADPVGWVGGVGLGEYWWEGDGTSGAEGRT